MWECLLELLLAWCEKHWRSDGRCSAPTDAGAIRGASATQPGRQLDGMVCAACPPRGAEAPPASPQVLWRGARGRQRRAGGRRRPRRMGCRTIPSPP